MARAEDVARSGGRRKGGLAKVALFGAGAIFVAGLVVQTSVAGALMRQNPFAALKIAPGNPQVQLRLAMAEFRQRRLMVTPQMRARADQALLDAPLAEEPLVLAGASAVLAKRPDEAQRLFEEARQRNPRSRATRLFLLDRYLRTGQTEQAAIEMSVLGRLIPEAGTLLIPELAKFALDADTIGALERVLRADPTFREPVLAHLARTQADPDLILRVAGALGPATTEVPAWQVHLLERLVKVGDVRRAYALWQRFTGVEGEPGLYNPRFETLPGPQPFNWTYASSGGGAAEPSANGTLEVQYYGREDSELAYQLLALSPGTYRLAMRVAGDTGEDGSATAWTLACAPRGRSIASLPLGGLSYAGKAIGATFTVPEDCPGQRLALIGKAQEFPDAENVTISDLRLSRAGNP